MKNLYLLFITLCLVTVARGQEYLSQEFNLGTWPPAGWMSYPIGSQWSLSATNNAGGTAPEAQFTGFNYSGTVRLVSPMLDVTDADTLILAFRYSPEVTETDAPNFGVSTRSGSGNWEVAWSTVLKNANEPRLFQVLLTGSNLGQPNFQFSFFLAGEMNNVAHFYLDDVLLYYPTDMDGKLDEILTPVHNLLPVPVDARIINLGNTTIHEVHVAWLTNLGVQHDSIFKGLDLGLFESFTVRFNRWWVSPYGEYFLKMWISSVNGTEDPKHSNDTLVKSITYERPQVPMRTPCFESFSSSTCWACADADSAFMPWWQNHPDIVFIYFPMPFPGPGDPYWTYESQNRMNYYDIDWVPQTYINGAYAYNVDTSVLQEPFDSARALTSDFIIHSSFEMDEDVITIHNHIFPFESLPDARVHTVVMEKLTTGNVGSNGVTEFHNVMMKNFPDGGYGEPVDFYSGLPYSQTFTASLEGTNIEEFDDLIVAVFIQQSSTNYILQSNYSTEGGELSAENRLSMITLDGQPLQGFDPDVFYYTVDLPLNTVESPVVFGETMHDSAWMFIQQAFLLPGSAVIDVYPENRGTMNRYIINFPLTTAVGENDESALKIYPNPATDKLFITGVEHYSLKLFSLDGKLIMVREHYAENILNLTGLNKGIYILQIITEEGETIMKKIGVM